ncbi:Peptidase S8 propeptide/proteinase inhibitor I9 [Vigna unguiculata]|uniref:Peptidase S8 propeptide/proteinase inhibitor I9 n=1 Tax=Vigna unguiculata TaxID=3917 RepID=A0A4D6MV61_VIGUN|nr:Peptidase S8 propeptide/proteinase inhibitor I9 [Vigna unguiculata]
MGSRHQNVTKEDRGYASYFARVHDSLLNKVFKGEKYLKLYNYHYLINGFVVLVTQQQIVNIILSPNYKVQSDASRSRDKKVLDWPTIYRIVTGGARGISYLR